MRMTLPLLSRSIPLSLLMLTSTLHADLVNDLIKDHPAGPQLAACLDACAKADITPTGLTKADYLKLIAGNIDFFKTCQNETGAIIDPISHGERQYSTPAFAAAASLLVTAAQRNDLLQPASNALTCALIALTEKKAADNHGDFYPPMCVHAFRNLKNVASPDQVAAWEALFRKIDPDLAYRHDMYHGNWNIVASSGEFLRRHDNLVAPEARDKQLAFLTARFIQHFPQFTQFGMYVDPNAPLAYDAFPRLWMEDVFADNAFDSPLSEKYEPLLRTAGLTSLLLLSPSGEWASGGRSAFHNWNECQIAAICEMNANYWRAHNNPALAGSFKRAAHLALRSVQRWQRPSGELNIIKNRAEPDQRFAYEGYSNHSQYNLLPMAMLAIAYERADDTIPEKAAPSEVGGYVLDLRETFHKIAAAAGGYYVLIDTAADPHYNATGLQRVHRAGVAFPALTDSAAAERADGGKTLPKLALSPALTWLEGDKTLSLSDFTFSDAKHPAKLPVNSVDLATAEAAPAHVAFTLTYHLASATDHTLSETYDLTPARVQQTLHLDAKPTALQLPILATDGLTPTDIKLTDAAISVNNHGSITTLSLSNTTGPLTLSPEQTLAHPGLLQRATAAAKGDVTLTYTLAQTH